MTDIPSTRSLEEIREVIEAICNPSNRSSMPRKAVVRVLEDVLLELMLLRADHREWTCLGCDAKWFRDSTMPSTCPNCNEVLQPLSWCLRKVYEKSLRERNDKIENLEFALSQIMDLEIDEQENTDEDC